MSDEVKLAVQDDDGVIAIQWRWPEHGVSRSTFPHPLLTVDYALDQNAIGISLVGSLAQELREAVWISDDEALALWQRLSGYSSANEPFMSIFNRIKERVGDPELTGPKNLTPANHYKAALARIVFAHKDGGASADYLAEIAREALDGDG